MIFNFDMYSKTKQLQIKQYLKYHQKFKLLITTSYYKWKELNKSDEEYEIYPFYENQSNKKEKQMGMKMSQIVGMGLACRKLKEWVEEINKTCCLKDMNS